MSLVDDLSTLFGVGPSSQASGATPPPAMANYGATPTAQGISQSSPSATVIARIKQPDQTSGTGSSSGSPNPLGLSSIPGGSDLGFAMQGLANVKPGQGKFSAFASGLGGALAARANAQEENIKLGNQTQLTNLEAMKEWMSIRQMQMQQDALARVGGIGVGAGSGGAYPSYYSGPGASVGGSPSDSSAGGAGPVSLQPPPGGAMGGSAPGPALPPSASGIPPTGTPLSNPGSQPAAGGQGIPAGPPPITVPAAIANSTNFWMRVDPESNPYFLRQRAGIMDQRALVPGLPADMANNFSRQAQQDRASAEAISNSNTVMTRNGQKVLIPGSIDSETTMAAAKAAAEKHAQNIEAFGAAGGVTPSGTKYLPDPSAPTQGQMGAPSAMPPPPNASAMPPAGAMAAAPMPAPSMGAQPQANSPPPPQQQASSIDPETANVSTVIPKAPAGGGYPIPPDLPPGAKMTALSPAGQAVQTADKDFYSAMGNAPALDQTIEKYQSLAQAFKLFQSGPRADQLQGAAMIAYGYGQPEIAQKILGGDPNALQWVEKEGAPLTLNALKSATTRFSQQEFKAYYGSAVPNPGKLPQANNQMIAEGLAQAQMQKQFNTDWQSAQQQGWQSPSAFYQSWSKANPANSFVKAAQRQVGNFQGMATPSPNDWAAGVSYVYTPKGMTPQQQAIFQQEGVKPGGVFRFNGRNADHAISPIDTSGGKGFSSQLQ